MYVLTNEEGGRRTGFGAHYRPQVFVRTAGRFKPLVTLDQYSGANLVCPDEACDLTFPDQNLSERVQPGDNVEMVLKTHHPVAAEAGQRFNIREGGRTVATGLVTRVLTD